MNYLKMLGEIDSLVSTDFMFDMECKSLPKSKPFNQMEAKKMRDILGKVYLVAHAIHCEACGKQYPPEEITLSNK